MTRYQVTRRWHRLLLRLFDGAGRMRRRRPLPHHLAVRRVLLIRRAAFGDLILLQPALRRAQALFPRAEIALWVRPEYRHFCGTAYPWLTTTTQPRGRYDVAVEFLGDVRLLWSARRRARAVVGYGLRGGGFLCDLELPYPHAAAAATRCVRLVEAAAGVRPGAGECAPRLPLHPGWHRAAAPLRARLRPDYLIVHPGCGDRAKLWPLAFWREFVWACGERGWPVVVTGAADERPLCADLGRGEWVRNWAGATTLAALAGLVAEAVAVVAPDTGVVHLARALGVPTVAIFETTDPAVWGSRAAPHVCLQSPRPETVLAAVAAQWRQAEAELVRPGPALAGPPTLAPRARSA